MDIDTLKRSRAGFPLANWELDETIKLMPPKTGSGHDPDSPAKKHGNKLGHQPNYQPKLPPLKDGIVQIYLVVVTCGECELWKIGITHYPIRERFRLDIAQGRTVRRIASYRHRTYRQAFAHEGILKGLNQGREPGAFPLYSGGNSETFNKRPHWAGMRELKSKSQA